LINHGQIAALKLEQDSINFIGSIPYKSHPAFRKAFNSTRYYRLSFFVNNLSDIASYADGQLSRKIRHLRDNQNSLWFNDHQGMFLNDDSSIKAKQPRGYIGAGDFLVLHVSVNLQNYKNYFVPSFSLGASLVLSNHQNFKRDIGLYWEPNFFFGNNSKGNLQSFRNDFLALTFGQGPVKDQNPLKESAFLTEFSIAYLIKPSGAYMDQHTLRIGAGALSLLEGKTRIEPILYFTGLFKQVTPGLRWIQRF